MSITDGGRYDLIVVGAGMLGLAHAYHGARHGMKVLVLERSGKACGASVRNFGMLATIAHISGIDFERSKRTLRHWRNIAATSDVNLTACGALFVAKTDEEMAVLDVFARENATSDRSLQIVRPSGLSTYSDMVRSDNLRGGLWAPEVIKIDQRKAMAKLAGWLNEAHAVDFRMKTEVRAIDAPMVATSNASHRADRIVVCSGDDFQTLFPAAFVETKVTRCHLQMLRTVPQPPSVRLEPFILGGLSIARYEGFQNCEGMAELKQQLEGRYPRHLEHGIHVISAQEADGSVTIGDSHHYGDDLPSDRKQEIDRLILSYLAEHVTLADRRIAERWLGHYASLPGTSHLMLEPQAGVRLVTMTNGQGLTQGFAVAEDVVETLS